VIDFKFNFDFSEVEGALEALAEALQETKVPLLRAGGQIRARAFRAFGQGGPGWAPLAPSTEARKITSAEISLFRSNGKMRGKTRERSIVERTVREAAGIAKWSAKADALNSAIDHARKAGKKTKGLESRLDKAYTQQRDRLKKIAVYAQFGEDAGISPRKFVAYAKREFNRARAHGKILRAHKELKKAGYAFDEAEQRKMLRQSARRYRADEDSTRILGTLDRTLGMKVDGDKVRVYSKALISGIHNDGGTAGHGARIPARPFLELKQADIDLFVEACREQALAAWEDA
jgi:phage gpG-like protein